MMFFKEDEFKCPCCGEQHMDKEFIEKFEVARMNADIPFIITSGWRCEKQDDKEAAACDKPPSRNHTTGRAVDIDAKNGMELAIILIALVRVGFRRFGFNFKTYWLHVDDVEGKSTPCVWTY